jgi:ABC-2 type transport system ATP-binding protein
MISSLESSQTRPAIAPDASLDLVIETRGLRKQFGGHTAVESLTMTVPMGTITGFVGPNGAGKTTTIRMLLGLIRPSAGSATVLGQPIAHPRRYLPRVGALIESPVFYPGLSGRKNLEVLARLGGYSSSRVRQVLDIVGLSDRASDLVRNYSLGMKQRLGVAMALLPDPALLILDEPTNGLDPLGMIQMRDLLRHLREQGTTIFLSSHLLGEVEQVTDWLVMLNQGKAVFCGAARSLTSGHGEVLVEAREATQLDLVARLAKASGYAVTPENGALRIACPLDWATELEQRANKAGVTGLTIHTQQASLEERFLALVKGAQP